MTNEERPEDPKDTWQNQSLGGTTMSLEEIRKGIHKLDKKVHARTYAGGIACLIVIASFTTSLIIFPNPIQRIGSALTVLGTGYLVYQLFLGRQNAAAVGTLPATGVKFYRSELERQRDFHRGLWLGSRLVIFAPGPFIFAIGFASVFPALARDIFVIMGFTFILLIAAVPLNLGFARRYQREIDALDSASA
jgi:hypothetical protein